MTIKLTYVFTLSANIETNIDIYVNNQRNINRLPKEIRPTH
jgi:hypothetical protein